MKAKVRQITLPPDKRVICISDIHGNLDLFKRLLDKIDYSNGDILILLGDLYTKGDKCHETLKYIIEMSCKPGVYILRGNCDGIKEYVTEDEKLWLNSLPHILESEEYIFVHGGITSNNLEEQDAAACMKNDAFMEKGLKFKKFVITGHWPTVNYTHRIPCHNPIVDGESRIISIDGGTVLKGAGQLNAFIICGKAFSFEYIDALPIIKIHKAQAVSGGSLNITWFDRFVEVFEEGETFSLYKHLKTGKILLLPNRLVWTDKDGNLCQCDNGTDYYLPVEEGEAVSLVDSFEGKILAKKNGTVGWINI